MIGGLTMPIKVLNLREGRHDVLKMDKKKDLAVRRQALRNGYRLLTYTIQGIRYWECCRCGFRTITEEDMRWHLRRGICL